MPGPAPGSGGRERVAWIVAGAAVLLAILVLVWRLGGARPAVPDMANPGNLGGGGDAVRAPDISAMSPQERFDRLFDRIMRAGAAGDSAQVIQFSPMALGAYTQLDSVNNDTRFHAAMIAIGIGEFAAALALSDTILATAPGHLFGYLVRGEAAERQNRVKELNQSYRDFLSHYDAELRAGRPEYAEHKPILDDFRTRAQASLGTR